MPPVVAKKTAAPAKTATTEPVKNSLKKAATKTVVEEPAPTPVVVADPVTETTDAPATATATVVAATESPLNLKLALVTAKLADATNLIKEVQNVVKALAKEVNVLVKQQSKQANKKSRSPRAPSGFAKPTTVSDEMYDFLKIEKGTPIARVDVTRKINEYIKANNLQNPADKRQIFPNDELRRVLKINDKDQVTFFNLQSYLSHHFAKSKPVEK